MKYAFVLMSSLNEYCELMKMFTGSKMTQCASQPFLVKSIFDITLWIVENFKTAIESSPMKISLQNLTKLTSDCISVKTV